MFANIFIVLLALVDLTAAKIIDLTHGHDFQTLMSPGNPKYARKVLSKGRKLLPGIYVEFNSYSLGEHGGTHMDAPIHFKEGGRTLDEIPIEDTILRGVMIDCSKEAEKNNSYEVTVDKLKGWEETNGRIPDGAAVIFNFGWSSRFKDAKLYFNTDDVADHTTFVNPYVGGAAADWMIDERNVKAIGADISCPDSWVGDFPVHVKFLLDNRLILENLYKPEQLPPTGFTFYFTPAKFVGATGSQVRAFAVLDSPNDGSRPGVWTGLLVGLAILVVFQIYR